MDARAIVVCADHEQAVLWADAAPAELRAHAVTGVARTAALLKEGRVGVLAGSPAELAALVARSALKLETVETVVVAWPESFAAELDTLLAEAAAPTSSGICRSIPMANPSARSAPRATP